jgi:ABC-type nickel/cobalt efflux system permease component RcnA
VRTERAALAVMDRDRPREHPVHSHQATDEHSPSAPPGPAGLLAMGLAGGLVPSPSALLVFLAALGLGHPWFGVALVLAFGVGMAGTLAATGLVVSRLRARAESRLRSAPRSRLRPLLDATPVLAATGVLVLGVLLTLRGLGGPGPL